VAFSFAATSTLARQVEAGAPADVFISANQAWIDWLEIKGTLAANESTMIAGNRLVIASSTSAQDDFNILSRDRFAMADPQSVPAGIYAQEALQHLGLWQTESDLHGQTKLYTQYLFPKESHTPIRYLAGIIKQSNEAKSFVAFLTGKTAQEIFSNFGFLPLSTVKTQ